MNTTKIGDKFENVSLSILEHIISQEQLGHSSRFLKIKRKAPYYSHKRKANIIFDLAIEVWPPGAERYTIIYLIECKHYGRRISVDKLNDFIYRVEEIAPVNGKAIFISNSPLQKSAYRVAESIGMMVIQGESSENYKIILHKTTRAIQNNEIPILGTTLHSELIDEGTRLLAKEVDKQLLSVFTVNLSSSHTSYGIDRLSKKDIQTIAYKELDKMNPQILRNARHISPKSLKEFLIAKYKIEIIEKKMENNMIGECDLEASSISVNEKIVGTHREFFVLAHEFGHFILHQKLSIGQFAYDSFADSEYDVTTGKYELSNPKNWIEWQANYFASCIILPEVPFVYRLGIVQSSLNISQGRIYLDDKPSNYVPFIDLVGKLAYRFDVSKASIIYKLKELGLINDQTRSKQIGQLIAEYAEDLFS
ncbi:MAG TPA: ImmA/IrrE family metallo-endopeptidase [Mucilaginibacter sp.]|nr:ImmA/IrrE family metallo-endopeptidase [Mucilaginibacter sp.]